MNREVDMTPTEPLDAQGLAGIGHRFVADVPAGAIVDLLPRVPDDADDDHETAPSSKPLTQRSQAAREVEALASARGEQSACAGTGDVTRACGVRRQLRSEEHTSELQSLR